MKILRIVHGLANNICDISVPDDFMLEGWVKSIKADQYVFAPPFVIFHQWIQHVVLLSAEEAAALQTQGMARN